MSVSAVSCRGGITSQFLRIIELSKEDASIKVLAANALSALVLAGISFAGRDLSGIQVPGAILDGGNFSRVNLSNANLEGCSLQDAFLSDADLEGACMSGVEFGQLPSLGKSSLSSFVALAYSPTGDRIATAKTSNKIKVWDAHKPGKLLLRLKGHKGWVHAVAYSPAGDRLVSGSADCTVKVWDAHTGRVLFTLKGHEGAVLSVVYSPSGDRIASGSGFLLPSTSRADVFMALAFRRGAFDFEHGVGRTIRDNTIRIWDARQRGDALFVLQEDRPVCALSYSPSGDKIASASTDRTIRVWNAHAESISLFLRGHKGAVNTVSYSPNGDKIASGGADKTVKIWDAYTGVICRTLEGHTAEVNIVVYAPSANRVVSGSSDRTLIVWDIHMGRPLFTFRDTQGIKDIAYSPDEGKIASVGDSISGTITLWKSELPAPKFSMSDGHVGCVTALSYSPKDHIIASGSRDGMLKIWDAYTGKLLTTLRDQERSKANQIKALSYCPSGNKVVTGGLGSLKIWDVRGKKLLVQGGEDGRRFVNALVYSPCGNRIASGSADGVLKIWDANRLSLELTIRAHRDGVGALSYSPIGDRIVSGSEGTAEFITRVRVVKIWDACKGELLFTLEGHKGMCGAVLYSPAGDRIASASGEADGDVLVKIWDANRGGNALLKLKHDISINAIAYSPTGNRVAVADCKSVKIWDAYRGVKALFAIKSSECNATELSYSPSKSELVSGHENGSVRVWQLKDAQGREIAPYLVWDSVRVLNLEGAQVTNVRGLSEENRSLLKQLRAEGDPERPDSEEEGHQRGRLECCIV